MSKCPKCQEDILDDSEFCSFCGCNLKEFYTSENRCHSCGQELEPDSSFCSYCGTKVEVDSIKSSTTANNSLSENKKHFNFKILSIILFAIVIALVVGLVYQGSVKNSANNELISQEERLRKTINSLSGEVTELKESGECYKKICEAAKNDSIGYAAYNFHCDTGIVVLNNTDMQKKVTLTAYWSNGGTVEIDNSNPFVAMIDFDKDEWSQSTTMTIKPVSKGITVVDFSNNVDNATFSLIIIVK